ncbi:hypothetical protein JY96_11215 [Aquabacterium sp. NJ1]|nr:hypothetical protein JY96_11215 [Aquabacterium sp. NJ1]
MWSLSGIQKVLMSASDIDLVVFPEYLPFDEKTPNKLAVRELEMISASCPDVPFIAGGSVVVDGKLRNAVFLCEQGKVVDHYYKRILWHEEEYVPGTQTKLFVWSRGRCVPLICADASDNPSPTGTRMMYEAIKAGAGPDVPIVVCTYGARFFEEYWQLPLQTWATGCDANVLVCAVSGKGNEYTDDDESLGHFGGGGSGLFRPGLNTKPLQRVHRGICVVDTVSATLAFQKLP